MLCFAFSLSFFGSYYLTIFFHSVDHLVHLKFHLARPVCKWALTICFLSFVFVFVCVVFSFFTNEIIVIPNARDSTKKNTLMHSQNWLVYSVTGQRLNSFSAYSTEKYGIVLWYLTRRKKSHPATEMCRKVNEPKEQCLTHIWRPVRIICSMFIHSLELLCVRIHFAFHLNLSNGCIPMAKTFSNHVFSVSLCQFRSRYLYVCVCIEYVNGCIYVFCEWSLISCWNRKNVYGQRTTLNEFATNGLETITHSA